MKINFGIFKGKKISYNVPANIEKSVRPTSAIVKSVLFNLLAHNSLLSDFPINDASVADFCCGTGAIGFEFLSLGAKSCAFFDEHHVNLENIQNNAKNFAITEKISVKAVDVLNTRYAEKGINGEYDIIFIDPPYEKTNEILSACFNLIKSKNLLKPNGLVIVETNTNINPEGFDIILKRDVRKDRFLFFIKQKTCT